MKYSVTFISVGVGFLEYSRCFWGIGRAISVGFSFQVFLERKQARNKSFDQIVAGDILKATKPYTQNVHAILRNARLSKGVLWLQNHVEPPTPSGNHVKSRCRPWPIKPRHCRSSCWWMWWMPWGFHWKKPAEYLSYLAGLQRGVPGKKSSETSVQRSKLI